MNTIYAKYNMYHNLSLIHILSIAFFQKVGLVMMASGVMSVILIILTLSLIHIWNGLMP